jgi:hypothetical protein
MNDPNEKIIAYEISRLRGAVIGLSAVIVLCTSSIILTMWNPEIMIFILILLGITFLTCLIGGSIGLGLGKSIKYFRVR